MHRHEQRLYIYILVPGTDWPKNTLGSPRGLSLYHGVFRARCDYEANPKDRGMGMGVGKRGNAVIRVGGPGHYEWSINTT